ncbi:unnamed protein product [Merluccius merluccius]
MDQAALCLLALCVGLLLEGGLCQHYYLLRPVPSDTLPLVGLKEDPDPLLDPGERDLNETELRSALGDFDGRFLSVSPPEDQDLEYPEDPEDPRVQRPSGPMPQEIRAAGFDVPPGQRQRAGRKLRRRLQQWLWAYSFCPVSPAWTDLGTRFWPRFVRAGGCLSKRSCSVPDGMRCGPADSTQLAVLRWRCAPRRGGLRCAWIQVRFPIITGCKCACAN